MKSFQKLETDVNCGWDDEVGASFNSYSLNLAAAQQKACEDLGAIIEEAEAKIAENTEYKSRATEISACRIK